MGEHLGGVGKKRWEDLSPGQRRLVVLGGVVDGVLKAAALVDLARRPAAEVKGSKVSWALFVTLVNSVGIAPLVYFVFGRRKVTSVGGDDA